MDIKNFLNYQKAFWTKDKIISVVVAFAFLAIALVIQKIADVYVGNVKGVAVPDLLLDHLPTLDIDPIIVQGALLLTFIIAALLVAKPRYLSFTVKTLSLFIITRSFFISLTHLGISPKELTLDTNTWGFGLYNFLYNTKGDFFFSGHTGAPYLMALIFWREKYWRIFFLITSVIFGVTVIFAHIHYSIDVFAAPFITFSIYTIAKEMFKKDFNTIYESTEKELETA